MNQRKVEIKLIRHLIQNAFNDQEKTINIDDCLEGKIIDVDILSLEHALQKIKTLNFEFNVINDLYYSILPGIEKKVYKKIFKTLFDDNLSPEEVYQQIIVKEIFHHLSFVMGALIYNILYYKKHKTFIVFFYKCAPELSSIMSNDINAKDFFKELKKVNATYHIKKFSPDIIELKQILLKVFNKN